MRAKEHNLQAIAKEELLRQNIKEQYQPAFLSAVIRGCGEISLSHKGYGLNISSDNLDLIKKCEDLINQRYNIVCVTAKSQKNIGMREISLYSLRVNEQEALKILEECRVVKGYEFIKGIPQKLLSSVSSKKTYLKGIFLSCSHVSAPMDKNAEYGEGKKGYHMEFSLNSELVIEDFANLLVELCGFATRAVRKRKNSPSLYVKSAQNISDILAVMGAGKSVVVLQEIMANRAMRNHLNRGNNFILANIDKTVRASDKQLKAIKKIDNIMGLENLDKSLREVALLRIENPDATLSQIAQIMGSVSLKSRINHRMRKIVQIANKL